MIFSIQSINRAVKSLQFWIGSSIGNNSVLFTLASWRPSIQKKIVHSESTICIEGFQRSGNTFFEMMFRQANPNATVAHHIHGAAHVIRAYKYGIPTIVLIRNPTNAVASLITYDKNLSVDIALRSYINYYTKLMSHRKKFVTVVFEDLISDYNSFIDQMNYQYGTQFSKNEMNEHEMSSLMKERQAKYKSPEAVPFPSDYKNSRNIVNKKKIKKSPYLIEATKTYQAFTLVSA